MLHWFRQKLLSPKHSMRRAVQLLAMDSRRHLFYVFLMDLSQDYLLHLPIINKVMDFELFTCMFLVLLLRWQFISSWHSVL